MAGRKLARCRIEMYEMQAIAVAGLSASLLRNPTQNAYGNRVSARAAPADGRAALVGAAISSGRFACGKLFAKCVHVSSDEWCPRYAESEDFRP